jgi:hypothetical protein
VIVVPAWAWKTMIDAFTAAPASAERVAFFDGVAGGRHPVDGGVVTTVTFPDAQVTAEATSRASRHLRPYGLVRLVQIRMHPPTGTGHPEPDDAAALSVALPGDALPCAALADARVHAHEGHGWRELEPDEVDDYTCVVPSMIDRRRPQT